MTDQQKIELLLNALRPFARASQRIQVFNSPKPRDRLFAADKVTEYELFSKSLDIGDFEDETLVVQHLHLANMAVSQVEDPA